MIFIFTLFFTTTTAQLLCEGNNVCDENNIGCCPKFGDDANSVYITGSIPGGTDMRFNADFCYEDLCLDPAPQNNNGEYTDWLAGKLNAANSGRQYKNNYQNEKCTLDCWGKDYRANENSLNACPRPSATDCHTECFGSPATATETEILPVIIGCYGYNYNTDEEACYHLVPRDEGKTTVRVPTGVCTSFKTDDNVNAYFVLDTRYYTSSPTPAPSPSPTEVGYTNAPVTSAPVTSAPTTNSSSTTAEEDSGSSAMLWVGVGIGGAGLLAGFIWYFWFSSGTSKVAGEFEIVSEKLTFLNIHS